MTGRAIPWTVRLSRTRCKPGCRCNRKPIGRIGAEARRNRWAEAWPPTRSKRRCRRQWLRPRACLPRCRLTPPIPPEPPFPLRAHRRRRRFAAAASGRRTRKQPSRAPAQERSFSVTLAGDSFDRGSTIVGRPCRGAGHYTGARLARQPHARTRPDEREVHSAGRGEGGRS